MRLKGQVAVVTGDAVERPVPASDLRSQIAKGEIMASAAELDGSHHLTRTWRRLAARGFVLRQQHGYAGRH
jgi:hypothetical protein